MPRGITIVSDFSRIWRKDDRRGHALLEMASAIRKDWAIASGEINDLHVRIRPARACRSSAAPGRVIDSST
jgi:hypothetical protein